MTLLLFATHRAGSALPARYSQLGDRVPLRIVEVTARTFPQERKGARRLRYVSRGSNASVRRDYKSYSSRTQAKSEISSTRSVGSSRMPAHWSEHLHRLSSSLKRKQQQRWMERVKVVNDLEPQMQQLTMEELKHKTEEFRMRLETGQDTVNSLLPEAFAAVREASKRSLNLRHFDVQVIGGMALHEGRIAEINTGEGKTLVATLPAYLNALTGKGVHIVTVNTYLASRDAAWMGRVFNTLGLSVGVVVDHKSGPENQAAFDADITYVTARDLGWIYLSDNSDADKEEHLTIRRPFHYAIVDEADSVLIDDAVQPLVISRVFEGVDEPDAWDITDKVCRSADWDNMEESAFPELHDPMQPQAEVPVRLWEKWGPWQADRNGYLQGEVLLDHRLKRLVITDLGYTRIVDQLVRLGHSFPEAEKEGRAPEAGDLWAGEKPLGQYIQLGLQAYLYRRGVDYLVKDGKVVLLSQNTGRTLDSSRWSHGLHQAVEVKEGLPPRPMDTVYASITYQMLFSLYPSMSGMTGTAESAEDEFLEMYKRSVELIPPHKPSQRIDRPVEVFVDPVRPLPSSLPFTAKQLRVMRLVCESLVKSQPVLLGTTTVEESEEWSALLSERGIEHQVLNATPSAIRREAEIIAQAGMPEAGPSRAPSITIATSMAGRGTDIRLGGDPRGLMQMALTSLLLPTMTHLPDHREDWLAAQAETRCPLPFWPRSGLQGVSMLDEHLPRELLAAVKSAASAVTACYFERAAKIPLGDAKDMLSAAFEASSKFVSACLFQTRRDFGDAEKLPASVMFSALQERCAQQLPIQSLAASSSEGVRTRIERAAVLLWLWLETCYCPTQAAEACLAGGLRVICTSMAPTWRVWDQLKGRSGRQGDPGETLVLLSWDADLRIDPVLREKFSGILGRHSDLHESIELPNSLAMRLILKPAMTLRESSARDARSQVKKSDEVLHSIRQELYSFRRWILRARPAQLQGLIRIYCYEVASSLVRQHVDPQRSPKHIEHWNIQQLLTDTWHLVDSTAHHENQRAQEKGSLQIVLPVQGLFGASMPQAGLFDEHTLQPAAEQLRQWLINPSVPQPPAISAAQINGQACQDLMLEARTLFLAGSSAKGQSFNGRFAGEAMQLVDYLACTLYLAWQASKRQQIKLMLQLSLPRGVVVYDSTQEAFPSKAAQGKQGVVDLEEVIQDWERRSLANSLTELWVGLLADSANAWSAANMTFLSRLQPLQEYTSSMSRRFVQLLDDHRTHSLQTLFAGPKPSEVYADPFKEIRLRIDLEDQAEREEGAAGHQGDGSGKLPEEAHPNLS